MEIEARHERGVAILEPKGRITIGVGDVALREAVAKALEAGTRNLVVDCGMVTGMDSSGLGELAASYTTVSNRGGKLKLANLPPKVTEILQITQLISVFEVYDDVDAALASFN